MTGSAYTERAVGPVVRIDIARPELRNALSPDDLHDLADRIARYDADPGIRVIVLSGQGTLAFSAGLDLKNRTAIAAEMAGQGPTGLGSVLRTARAAGTPVIGRINGACVAGGMGLLAACHAAVAADHAIFALPEIRHGLYPHVVLVSWAGRLAKGALDGMAKTGDPISAMEAKRIGLVETVVPPDQLDTEIDRIVQEYLKGMRSIWPKPLSDETMCAAERRTRFHATQNR